MSEHDWQMNDLQRAAIMDRWQLARPDLYTRFFAEYPQYASMKESLLAVADTTYAHIIDALAQRAPHRRRFEALHGDGAPRQQQQAEIEADARAAEQRINSAVRDGRRALRHVLGRPPDFEEGYDALADPALALMKPIIAQATMNFRQVCGTHVVIDGRYWGSNPDALAR